MAEWLASSNARVNVGAGSAPISMVDRFAWFMENTVNLNQSRIDLLEKRLETLSKYLVDDAETADELIPQGSHAHGTIIRPVAGRDFDVDALVLMEYDPDIEPKEYIARLYSILRDHGTYKDMVSRNTRCVTVDYAGDFHVDLVPYVIIEGKHYITNRHTNEFENTNPEGFTEWLLDAHRATGGHLIEAIRLHKYLRDHKGNYSCPSIILTTLLGNMVDQGYLAADHYTDLPTALVNITAELDVYLQARPTMPVIQDPSCPELTFNHRWDQDKYTNFRDKMHLYSQRMQEAHDTEDDDAAVKAWQKVFGDKFITPPATDLVAMSNTQAVAKAEQFIDRDFGFTKAQHQHRFAIAGTVARKKGFRAGPLVRTGHKVHKNRVINFAVTSSDIPEPYDIYWKVRNHGEEAELIDQLRGQIFQGGKTHREHTAYHGSHYVEAYAVKDGEIVATARQPVHVI